MNPRPLAEMLEREAERHALAALGLVDPTKYYAFMAAVSLLLPCVEALQKYSRASKLNGWSSRNAEIADQVLTALRDKLEAK